MKATPLFSTTANKLLRELNTEQATDKAVVDRLFDQYVLAVQDQPGEIQIEVEIPRLQNAFNAGYEACASRAIAGPDEPVLKDIKQGTRKSGREQEPEAGPGAPKSRSKLTPWENPDEQLAKLNKDNPNLNLKLPRPK